MRTHKVMFSFVVGAMAFLMAGLPASTAMHSEGAVKQNGSQAVWYVAKDNHGYLIGSAVDALSVMRKFSLGISNADIAKIPVGTTDIVSAQGVESTATDNRLVDRVKGKILLQVQQSGQAWYVNPVDGKRYFLGRPMQAKQVLGQLAKTVNSKDLAKVKIHSSIVDIAIADNNFSTLVQAVVAAGLVDTLAGEGPFTVFAPTNEAFAKIPAETLEALLANPTELAKVLTYHVVAGKVTSTDVVKLNSSKTVEGSNVSVKVENGSVMINDSKVIAVDVMGSNGVIHAIDTVLLPPTLNLAPVEEVKPSIVDIAVDNGSFKILVAALQATGLDAVLAGDGPFTVFAPTDEAFAKLPEGTVEALLQDKETLSAILTYHVVPGALKSGDVVSQNSLTTVQGGQLQINTTNGVKVNDSNIVTVDIEGRNGVIHVIDTVLLP